MEGKWGRQGQIDQGRNLGWILDQGGYTDNHGDDDRGWKFKLIREILMKLQTWCDDYNIIIMVYSLIIYGIITVNAHIVHNILKIKKLHVYNYMINIVT